jgi:hypothetical protein
LPERQKFHNRRSPVRILSRRVKTKSCPIQSLNSGVRKKSFAEAAAECNAISVKEFTNELKAQIEKWSDDDARGGSF